MTLFVGTTRHPVRLRVCAALGVVLLLHLIGIGLYATSLSNGGSALPLGFIAGAYLLGLKHSYDWDHIAAIDNSIRRFVANGRNPVSVGLAFSLGHSTVVTLAGVLVLLTTGFMGTLFDTNSTAGMVLATIGSLVSGIFLLIIGLSNAFGLKRAVTLHRIARDGGQIDPQDLQARGVITRLIEGALAKVRGPRDVFGIGFLFGLGFDTATTIGVFMLAAAAAVAGVPPLALLAMPVMFTAAMSLFDTTNGFAVVAMYHAALAHPGRKLAFNLAITSVAAVSALLISVLILATWAHEAFGLSDPVTTWLSGIDLGHAGLGLVCCMLLVGGIAALASGLPPRRRDAPTES